MFQIGLKRMRKLGLNYHKLQDSKADFTKLNFNLLINPQECKNSAKKQAYLSGFHA